MKLLEFRPKLFDCLKNYSKRTFASDLMGRHHRRHRPRCRWLSRSASPRRIAREGHRHGHPRRTGRLAAGRKPRTDRRAYGRIHRHHIRHHPAIRRGGPDRRHADGRRAARTDGRLPARSRHQVHPLPRRRRLHDGIAVTIFTTQIADVFGLDFGGEKVPATLSASGCSISATSARSTGGTPPSAC